MMKTLYVTDLDGTLLNMQETINQYSLDIINELVQNGILFTYATARSLASASIATKGLLTEIPIISYNGAFIMKILQMMTGLIVLYSRNCIVPNVGVRLCLKKQQKQRRLKS